MGSIPIARSINHVDSVALTPGNHPVNSHFSDVPKLSRKHNAVKARTGTCQEVAILVD